MASERPHAMDPFHHHFLSSAQSVARHSKTISAVLMAMAELEECYGNRYAAIAQKMASLPEAEPIMPLADELIAAEREHVEQFTNLHKVFLTTRQTAE